MFIIRSFKALSDETRIRLYHLLLHFEFSVNEIVQVMEMGQSRISRHLKVLAESGLLVYRRDGSYMYYQGSRAQGLEQLISFVMYWTRDHELFVTDLAKARTVFNARKERTRIFFNSVAGHWDRLKQEVLGEFDLERVIQHWAPACSTAVDLGCGTGEGLLHLTAKADQVIGVDSSPKMLEKTKSRVRNNNLNVELRLGELEHLPMSDQEAELAVANMVLRHVSEPVLGLHEVQRVLQAGSIFILADFDHHEQESLRQRYGGVWLGFKLEDLQSWLLEAGFTVLDVQQHDVRQGLQVNVVVSKRK